MPRLTPALVISLALAAAAPATASAAPATVSIVAKSFGPTVTVAPGDAVTWNWASGPHNVHVTSGPETFDSGIKDAGGTYTRTLTAPGTYTYQCDVHPTMHGTVVVGSSAAAAPAAVGPAGALAGAPALRSVTVSRLAVVRVSSATAGRLSIRLLRDGRVARRSTASLTAGVNHVPLSVRGLPRGRYRVQLQATTAAGRRSATVVRSLLVTRAVLARRLAAAPAPAPAPPVAPPAAPADNHGGQHHAADAATPPA